MIRPEDFKIEMDDSDHGTTVRVTHIPTGNDRVADAVTEGALGKTRQTLIRELKGLLFGPEDVRFDTGRAEGGDFIRVVHTPSGIERCAMRRDSTHEQLLDAVLEEVFSANQDGD